MSLTQGLFGTAGPDASRDDFYLGSSGLATPLNLFRRPTIDIGDGNERFGRGSCRPRCQNRKATRRHGKCFVRPDIKIPNR